MAIDRTTKLLLFALTLGVWGLLLRPVFTPETAKAQGLPTIPGTPGTTPAMWGSNNLYIAAPSGQSGRVYRFKGELGRPVFIGEYGPHVSAQPD